MSSQKFPPDDEPPLKRLKTDNATLSEDALSIVLEFLAPKELMSMAFTCKGLRSKISTRLVCRCALMHSDFAGRTIHELYILMKRKAIHVPSPLRLLRLINGKRCECCQREKVNFIRNQGFGVFFCWDCVKASTAKLNTATQRVQRNPRYAELLGHPRVLMEHFNGGRKYFCWSRQFVSCCGEICGPLVTYDDIQTTASAKTAVDDIVSHAPPESAYEEFIEAYENSTADASARQTERYEKKRIARDATQQKRKENALRMIGQIRELLDSSWRDYALDYTDSRSWRNWHGIPCVRFKIGVCNELLEPYVLSPSKAKTKSVVSSLAAKIDGRFRAIESFLKFSFLSDAAPFELRLKQYCQQRYPDLRIFLRNQYIDEGFYPIFASTDLTDPYKLLIRLMAPELYDGVLLLPLSVASPPSHKQLASHIWRAEWAERVERHSGRISIREGYRTVFAVSRTAFLLYKERAEEYISWLRNQDGVQDLFVTYAENDTLREPEFLEFLLKEDFAGLKASQERSRRSFPV